MSNNSAGGDDVGIQSMWLANLGDGNPCDMGGEHGSRLCKIDWTKCKSCSVGQGQDIYSLRRF